MVIMKWVAGLLLASSWLWAADQAKDRAAIDNVIASWNSAQTKRDSAEVWSEMSRPVIVTRSVQFLSAKVARVEATRVQYGSISTRQVPVVILLEKTRAGWKITSFSESAEPPTPIQPVRLLPQ
jgi:hypothetical protein